MQELEIWLIYSPLSYYGLTNPVLWWAVVDLKDQKKFSPNFRNAFKDAELIQRTLSKQDPDSISNIT